MSRLRIDILLVIILVFILIFGFTTSYRESYFKEKNRVLDYVDFKTMENQVLSYINNNSEKEYKYIGRQAGKANDTYGHEFNKTLNKEYCYFIGTGKHDNIKGHDYCENCSLKVKVGFKLEKKRYGKDKLVLAYLDKLE